MCRSTVDNDAGTGAGFRPRRSSARDCLEIRAFYLRLSSSKATGELALVYLPSIGGAALELNGRKLPPASPAPVALIRHVKSSAEVYASADRVLAGEGARFEVYAGEEKAAEGVFLRRRGGDGWGVECRRWPAASAVVAEVVVVAEGGVVMKEKVRSSRRGFGRGRLEEIPEEWVGGCDCECGEEWEVVGEEGNEEVVEMETVSWAVEVGILAVCLGAGLFVSRAAARRLGRKRIFG